MGPKKNTCDETKREQIRLTLRKDELTAAAYEKSVFQCVQMREFAMFCACAVLVCCLPQWGSPWWEFHE